MSNRPDLCSCPAFPRRHYFSDLCSPRIKKVADPFTAMRSQRDDDLCSECGGRDGGHFVECSKLDSPRARTCERCFTVHVGECL